MREGTAISTRRDRYASNGINGQGFHPYFTKEAGCAADWSASPKDPSSEHPGRRPGMLEVEFGPQVKVAAGQAKVK